MDAQALQAAADAIRSAQALVITAGAGMGVDSGLPDFRGPQGFWRAYPAYQKLGLRFEELANPRWFAQDPELAWGFYGHRLNLYRATQPHAGFSILKKWAATKTHGAFVVTSNVDGHFQKAGFDPARVFEVHGSLLHMQCVKNCGVGIFPGDKIEIAVDPESFRAKAPLPACPSCRNLARPNVLMFGDYAHDATRSHEQRDRFQDWLSELESGIVVIELGAGSNVPTIRIFSEQISNMRDARLIRINLRESEVPRGEMGLAGGALEVLQSLDSLL